MLRQTTIDYTLLSMADTSRIARFEVGEDCGLDSDHLPQFGVLDMKADLRCQSMSQSRLELKELWNLSNMDTHKWTSFERCCDRYMIQWMAHFEPSDAPQTEMEAN